MDKNEVISVLKTYFQNKADVLNIDMAFLYGSWASGLPKKESDIDIAVALNQEISEESIFEIITEISLELTDIIKKETNVLHIDKELSRPMLHYNAIVHGVPVYIRDFTRFVDIKLRAMHQMEDFGIFGIKWQSEIVRRRLEAFKHA